MTSRITNILPCGTFAERVVHVCMYLHPRTHFFWVCLTGLEQKGKENCQEVRYLGTVEIDFSVSSNRITAEVLGRRCRRFAVLLQAMWPIQRVDKVTWLPLLLPFTIVQRECDGYIAIHLSESIHLRSPHVARSIRRPYYGAQEHNFRKRGVFMSPHCPAPPRAVPRRPAPQCSPLSGKKGQST